MITFEAGNIFDMAVQAIVNPVNCVDVMRAGLGGIEDLQAYIKVVGGV